MRQLESQRRFIEAVESTLDLDEYIALYQKIRREKVVKSDKRKKHNAQSRRHAD